jgi:hypothetical protein
VNTLREAPRPGSDNSSLSAAVTNAIVGVMCHVTGRGPTMARTTIQDAMVVVRLQTP